MSRRPLVSLALILATTLLVAFSPSAAADDCVEANTSTFADDTRLIANAGRQIAVGGRVGPIDEDSSIPIVNSGAGVVVIITPASCGVNTNTQPTKA